MRTLRLANNSPAAPERESFIGLANAFAIDADGWATIPFGDSHHNAQDGRAAAGSAVPEALRGGVIQRFDRAAAEAIVADFRSLWGRVKRAVMGLPVFRGHPDAPRFANIFPDKSPRGTISDMEVTDQGLRIRPVLTGVGVAEVESGLSDFSPYWDLRFTNAADPETGLPVYSPFRLHSIGLVKRGNIPGLSLINADLLQMKNWLIQLLAALGITVPADTADDAFGPFLETALDKIKSTAATATQEKADAEAKLATANASIATLTSQLTAANTKATTAEANARTEREARAGLVVDAAVATGRVAAAERAVRIATLANAADFATEAAAIGSLKPTLKTQSALGSLSQEGHAQQERQAKLLSLVNAHMTNTGDDYDKAFTSVASTEAGKALLAGMKKPGA